MKYKSKSRCKINTKKPLKRKELSVKQKRSRSARRSLAPSEKRKTILEHLKRKQAIKRYNKYANNESLTEDSYDMYSSHSSSSSPNLKKTRFKRLTLDSSLKCDSADKNKTFHKDNYFKDEFTKAQAEIVELKSKLRKANAKLEDREVNTGTIKQEIASLKKKMKNYRYYKEKAKEYRTQLKEASKQ